MRTNDISKPDLNQAKIQNKLFKQLILAEDTNRDLYKLDPATERCFKYINYIHRKTNNCFISQTTMKRSTGHSVTWNNKKHVKILVARGFIITKKRGHKKTLQYIPQRLFLTPQEYSILCSQVYSLRNHFTVLNKNIHHKISVTAYTSKLSINGEENDSFTEFEHGLSALDAWSRQELEN